MLCPKQVQTNMTGHTFPACTQVYQFLTAAQGDAYLGYTQDKRLMFTNGITLHVRCAVRMLRRYGSVNMQLSYRIHATYLYA